MNIKIEYTKHGEEYINTFDISENEVEKKLNETIDYENYYLDENEIPVLLNRVIDRELVYHSVYGYLSKKGNDIIFKIDLISSNISKKIFNSQEILIKARKK